MDSVRIAILGEAGVGKSALTVRSITGRFLHHYDPTLEDEYNCQVSVDGQLRPVTLMDTAGQVSQPLACISYLVVTSLRIHSFAKKKEEKIVFLISINASCKIPLYYY